MITPEPLLKVDDVAKLLNVSRRSVYQYMSSGALPYRKIGGLRRIEPRELRKFIGQGGTE